MKRKTSELKTMARKSLEGQYLLLIGAMILIGMVSGMGSGISLALFGGDGIFSLLMNQLFLLIITLIVSVFSAGTSYIFLKIARGEKADYRDIFYMFQHHPDRIIIVSFILSVIQLIATIPYQVYTYNMALSSDIEAMWRAFGGMMGWLLLGLLISAVISLPLTLSYLLLIDDDQLGAVDAIKMSASMMKGNYGRYIYLNLSFIGLMILGICSFYIGFLWIAPYLQMTQTQFYRELKGELDSTQSGKINAVSEGHMNPQPQVVKDDYNAEA